MIILGIETSCDDTCVALVEDGKKILSNIISSQAYKHKLYQGVVPEVASREHVKLFLPTLDLALKKAKIDKKNIDGIAVTVQPGLSGALMVGMQAAKTLAFVWQKPLVAVNHLMAHFYALDLSNNIKYPYWALLASGGHTMLAKVYGALNIEIISTTNDDACGECFDKIAKHYELGFPGGPAIEKMAKKGNCERYCFPKPSLKDPIFFNYSGLKTAVAHHLKKYDTRSEKEFCVHDLAASFQKAACSELVKKSMALIEQNHRQCPPTPPADSPIIQPEKSNIDTFGICGGVASNEFLRKMMEESCEKKGLRLVFPPPTLCTDNGAMIAGLGYHMMKKKQFFSPTEEKFFLLQVNPKKVRQKGFLK